MRLNPAALDENGIIGSYSQVWFNTPRQAALARLATAQMPQRLQ
jgi:hypothetical protein